MTLLYSTLLILVVALVLVAVVIACAPRAGCDGCGGQHDQTPDAFADADEDDPSPTPDGSPNCSLCRDRGLAHPCPECGLQIDWNLSVTGNRRYLRATPKDEL